MHSPYWIYKDGHQSGPFTFPKIQSMWRAGTINHADQVRPADRQEWRAIGEISRHLNWGYNALGLNVLTAIILTFIGCAVLWGFAMIWWFYS